MSGEKPWHTVTFNGQWANTNGIATYGLRQTDGLLFSEAPGARLFVLGSAVPEPSSLVLLAMALPVVAYAVRRRRLAAR